MSDTKTVIDLLQGGKNEAVAITGPGRKPLTYSSVLRQVADTVSGLNKLGVGRNDPVAMVLPNGPEMAAAFIAIAAGATSAPLNPAYREEELQFYMSDLEALLLVVEEGSDTPARSVAEKLRIPVAQLRPSPDADSIHFDLVGDAVSEGPRLGGFAEADDIALVLHTSGTTSRPKMVPLSHRNVCASAQHIVESLSLVPEDRCLNVMPLFHIHGLMAAVLSTLAAGASVFCTPGFNALKFFSWMKEANPSWYTAVPTMHQAILNRASRNREIIESTGLRFLRSSSASLPPQVMKELEETFSAPLIEAYGMTEAAHQMASNPLPPRVRKPGAVGVPTGAEISIIDETGRHLSAGSTGEVVIRGPNVTAGYQNNPDANAKAFSDGWFRTGDQGVIDHEGYLRLTGRLKEIINRGGEKVSPLEVDAVLIAHPAVAQAVTFAVPHDKLGEEVAAALVLKEGATTTKVEIREFAGRRLADFKVPRRVIFLDEIPKGPTGKLQRMGLAEKLGLA
ncbi:acyl--CoA ligase [Acidobacteria bacterium AH-259-D05]|nr:acyl--CoA ligase [Acidobacteria bacterium AH-259-D05]